jgi:hypothetical protein
MIKGILYVLKGFFIWSCFCYLPFGFVIILSILNQPLLDWKILTLFVVIWLIALIVCDRWFEQFKKKII